MMRSRSVGLSLVEILIAMALMATVMVSFSMFALKISTTSDSYSKLGRSQVELNSLMAKMQKQLANASWIDATSYNKKIVFTTLDDNGNPQKMGYRITTSGSKTVLEYSIDGTTWGSSPYAILSSTDYNLDSGEFLFCGYGNNCTRFLDDVTVNDQYDSGEGRTQVSGSLLLTTASSAQKVVLSGFVFNRQMGNPAVKISWPDVYVHLPPQQVSPTTVLVQSFNTTPAASNGFVNGFNIRSAFYDWQNGRLIAVGDTSSNNYIYQLSRDGVRMDSTADTIGAVNLDDACLDADGKTLLAFIRASSTFNKYDLSSTTPGTVTDTFTITFTGASYFGASGQASGITCDPNTPGTFYVIGRDGGTPTIPSIKKISRVGTTTTLVSTISPLPAGMQGTGFPGFMMDPATGDFYALPSTITGSAPNATMTVYHITQSSPSTTDTFTINISTLGSTASGTAVGWGMGFDPYTNHMFIGDTTTNKIYEFIPPRLLSPKI